MANKKTTMQLQVTLITNPAKGETPRDGLIETLRAMADGLEDGRLVGGTPSGGHWSINLQDKALLS